MKYILLYIGLAVVLSRCNKGDSLPPPSPDGSGWQTDKAIDISGTGRNYHLYVPQNPVNAPMVILLHGNRSSNSELMGFGGQKAPYKAWETVAQQENLILVVPNGTNGSNGHRGWNDCRSDATGNPNSDDVSFIDTLIDAVLTEYQANASKVHVIGTSNGGHMAMRLAQEIPEKLAAFAAIVASNPRNSQCTNSTIPISALFMNGTEDPINPYSGGAMSGDRGEVDSAQEIIDYWVNRNQTVPTPVVTDFADTDTSDNCTVTKHLYENGSNNTEVAFYEVVGGGHTEPSISERYSNVFKMIVKEQNGDIEMANEVWNFFENK